MLHVRSLPWTAVIPAAAIGVVVAFHVLAAPAVQAHVIAWLLVTRI